MTNESSADRSRRRFLKFLAGSPLLAPSVLMWGEEFRELGNKNSDWVESFLRSTHARTQTKTITSPDQALDVFDFEAKAKEVLPPQHYAYMVTGSDDDATVVANQEGYNRYVWHPRRLVDVSKIDASIQLFGQKYNSPIFTAPTSGQKAWHRDGEIAVAKGCKPRGNTMVLSTSATTPIEEVIAARGAPVWFQLYPNGSYNISKKFIERAEAAGAPAVCMTVDQLPGRNTVTDQRAYRDIPGYTGVREESPACNSCHKGDRNARREMSKAAFAGETRGNDAALTWDFVKRLRDVVKGKFMLKGVITPEDAELSVKYGLDAVYVSNHGGRSAATGYGTIEALPAIVTAVKGRVPIIIDGGIRRGTSVFKALGLGASAVVVGRPMIWGLGSFGEPGVVKVMDILQREFELVMKQAGVTSVPAIAAGKYVTRR